MRKQPRMNGNKRELKDKESASVIGVHSRSFSVTDFFPPRPESRPTIYAYEDTNPQWSTCFKK